MISCLSQQYSDPYLSPTTPTLPLPSVSLIGALLAYQYMPLASLNLPAILVFSLLSTLLPTDPLLLSSSTTPPDYLGTDQLSTNVCYLSTPSYNDCDYHRSLPHTTSYLGSIGSHDHHISQLVSSRSPSSFDLNCSFLIQ